ncbi:PAS domain S-box protein [Actinoplanes philippinensis]|uniref:PAS domain S-box protein n=1 Tax=Actinoplanes philippinensis TaxID=35752 RepID=UPI003407B7FF
MRGPEIDEINVSERAELERLRQIISTGPTGFVSIDADGIVRIWNRSACRLLGWTPDEIIGRPLTELLIPAELRAAHTAGMARYLASGEPTVIGKPVSLAALHADGRRIELEFTIWPSWVGGERHFYAFMRDMSEQRAAEEQAARHTRVLLATIDAQRAVTAAAHDHDKALRVVAEQVMAVFPAATGAAVELMDGGFAAAGALTGYTGLIGVRARPGSLAGEAIDRRRVVRCADTATDERVDREACLRIGVRSMCAAPLYSGDRLIGVVKAGSDRPDAFGEVDAHHLELLAASLASTLRYVDDYARNATLLAERTAALEALELSDTRFRLTFENSPLGLALSSVDERSFGRYLQVNPAMSAITGYSAEELLGMSFRDLQHPDDVAATETALRQMITTGPDTVRVERRYVHREGRTIWVSIRVAVVRGGDRAPSYVVVQVEDVTAQRAADARLRQMAALLKIIPVAVIVRRLDGTVLWWNSGAQSLYGWTPGAAAGRLSDRLLNTVFEDGSAAEQRATLESDGVWSGRLQHLTAAGRTVSVLSRQVVHRTADGEVEVLEINTDVTAARAAEQALALNDQRFRAQFTHSAVGQVIRALDGSLIAVNEAFAGMLGRFAEDLIGRDVDEELLGPDDRSHMHNEIAGLFAGDATSYTHEARLRHADGYWVDAEITVSLVRDSQNRPKHLIVVATDVSQRRIAERARDDAAAALAERNTALEVANQLKLDIIGMLGHEISNPLSAILGYSDLLADDCEAGTPAAMGIGVISRQAQRLDEIVREVLSMVSIDAGNLSAVRGEVSLHDGIAQALESAGATGVPVTGPDVALRFNPGHLQQVLVNLLSNAAKYAGGATCVRIEPSAGGRVLLRVEDRGPGVPEEFRPRLFERLTRAERDAGSVRGTGLGLYIVRSLARANHGEVRHEPHPAGGSVFVLEAEPV